MYAAGDSFPEEEFTVELEPVISGSNLVPDEKEIHLTLGAGKTKEEKRFAPISFYRGGNLSVRYSSEKRVIRNI